MTEHGGFPKRITEKLNHMTGCPTPLQVFKSQEMLGRRGKDMDHEVENWNYSVQSTAKTLHISIFSSGQNYFDARSFNLTFV